jgi:apolipoprotein N-acyltransferase
MKQSVLRWNSALFLSGAIGALSLPPFGLWPFFLWPMCLSIIRLDHCETGRQAFLSGWVLGFGYFLAGLWWIGSAFLVEPKFIWAMPLAIVGLPFVLAFFFALAFAACFYFWRPGFSRILIFSLILTAAELLRGEVFSGFPWNAIGMVLGSSLELSQIASVVGLSGLNFLVALLFAAPILFFTERKKTLRFGGPFVFVIGITALCFFGYQRLNAPQSEVVAGVRIRIMQPVIVQDEKFDKEYAAEILTQYLSLSTRGSYPSAEGMKGTTHLIWPETAFPFLLDHSPKAREEISRILPKSAVLITGAVRAEDKPDKSDRFYFNSIQVLDELGTITASADKVHLVPFGEYLPFEGMIDFFGLRNFITAPGGFTAAEKRTSLGVPSWPLTLPLICYEAIFPEQSHLASGERPGVLLNVTNDAWFGLTPGPYQHYAQARLRAIELGIPLIRAANNGISAIIDSYGRERARIELGERGIIDGDLPTALPETVYSRLSADPISALWLFIGLIGILFTLGQITPRRVGIISATSDR